MAAPRYFPTHDDDALFPIEQHPIECHSKAAPSSSSLWSGPGTRALTFVSFHSSTASDSFWREPVGRLRRWKGRVADRIELFQSKGKEGIKIIEQQPLRVHGKHNELRMIDCSPLPDDLIYWKKSHAYFQQEGRKKFSQIFDERLRRSAVTTAKLQWIYDWMEKSEAAQNAGELDSTKGEDKPAMEDAATRAKPSLQAQPMRRSARMHTDTGRQAFERTTIGLEKPPPAQRQQKRKRLDADAHTEAGQEQTAPQDHMYAARNTRKGGKASTPRRARLEHSDITAQAEAPPPSKRQRQQRQPAVKNTAGKRQPAPRKEIDKGKAIAAGTKDRPSSRPVPAGRRDGCTPPAPAQTQQPLRRSLRIAARRKAAGNRD